MESSQETPKSTGIGQETPKSTGVGVINEDANLYHLPKPREGTPGNDERTLMIGDLHGNAIKLLYFLIREGVLEINTTDLNGYPEEVKKQIEGKSQEEIYDELGKIYHKDPDIENHPVNKLLMEEKNNVGSFLGYLREEAKSQFVNKVGQLEKKDVDFFEAIIANAKFTSHPKIVIIGDELCDRGSNDGLTLSIFEKLGKESKENRNLSLDIFLSNHGMELYSAILKGSAFLGDDDNLKKRQEPGFQNTRYLVPTNLIFQQDQGISLQNLGASIKKGLFDEERIRKIVKDHCIPNLKLLNMVTLENGQPAIISHAPIGMETIKALANALRINKNENPEESSKIIESLEVIDKIIRENKLENKDEKSVEAIKNVINAINLKFQKFLNELGAGLGDLLILGVLNEPGSKSTDEKAYSLGMTVEQLTDWNEKYVGWFEKCKEKGIDSNALAASIKKIVWNRERDKLFRPEGMVWINGHDNKPGIHEITLDNHLGKDSSYSIWANHLNDVLKSALMTSIRIRQFLKNKYPERTEEEKKQAPERSSQEQRAKDKLYVYDEEEKFFEENKKYYPSPFDQYDVEDVKKNPEKYLLEFKNGERELSRVSNILSQNILNTAKADTWVQKDDRKEIYSIISNNTLQNKKELKGSNLTMHSVFAKNADIVASQESKKDDNLVVSQGFKTETITPK